MTTCPKCGWTSYYPGGDYFELACTQGHLFTTAQLAAQYVAEQQAVNATCDRYAELREEFEAMPDDLPLSAQVDSVYMQADLGHVAQYEVGSTQWFDAVEEIKF